MGIFDYMKERDEYRKIVDWIKDSYTRNTLFRIYGPANLTFKARQKIKEILG